MGKRFDSLQSDSGAGAFHVAVVDVVDTDTEPGDYTHTPDQLLRLMRSRLKYYGSPIPDGYVAPPGIDLAALLKQVPWPPAA